jgi:hypothetical protein
LITTLGARGWTRERRPTDPPPKDAGAAVLPVATNAFKQLAGKFFDLHEPPMDLERLGGIASGQIGYKVVSRRVVIAVLGGFCVALSVCGLWLARIGRLECLGWLGPALAILAACLLGLAGRSARTAVPASVAEAQVAEVDPDVDEVRVTGSTAIYRPDASKPRLAAERGGVFSLDMEGLAGTTRRMLWSDLDRWHWENLLLPSGVRTAPFRFATSTGRRIRARAIFGPEGLSGSIESGILGKLEDTILATGWSRSLAVRLSEGGRFTARTDDVLAPEQLVQGTVLSQRQQWTQQAVRCLLENPAARGRFQKTPALLGRATPVDTHLGLLEDVERLGGALAVIPIEFERPRPKTRVLIPSPFLPYRSVSLEDGSVGGSAIFNGRDGKWLGPLEDPTQTLLRFQCPEQILPLRCQAAKLTISIIAPSRTMTILGIEDGKAVSLARVDSPVGTMQFTIDRAGVLKLDRGGGLLLEIRVGPMQAATTKGVLAQGWKINDVQLELSGEAELE